MIAEEVIQVKHQSERTVIPSWNSYSDPSNFANWPALQPSLIAFAQRHTMSTGHAMTHLDARSCRVCAWLAYMNDQHSACASQQPS